MNVIAHRAAPALAATTEPQQAPDAALLDQIISRVDVIEAKQGRPSPVHLRSWEEIERFAAKAARSGMVPKDYVGKPDAICIAIQMGSELGLAPMQSLQNIAVVNGRPAVWGDALPALCRASGLCVYIREWHEGEGDALTYYCEAKRKDDPNPIRAQFSVGQAKKASLWGKNVWAQYPERMLQMRARGFGLRDAFPDVLKGLITTEEARDIPFEETGLTLPPQRPQSMGEIIGDSLPPHATGEAQQPKRKTWTELLDEIEASFVASTTRDAVDTVLSSDAVQKALDKATNGARDRLNAIISAAIGRTALTDGADAPSTADDDWPGPDPDAMRRAQAAE